MLPRTAFRRTAPLLSLVPAMLLLALAVAQEPPMGKRGEEEEDPKKPMGKRGEEEEGAPKKVIRVEEPDPMPGKKPPAAGPLDIDLATAARQAANPEIKKFFQSLAIPHDEIHRKRTEVAVENVKPLAAFIGTDPSGKAPITLQPFDKNWKLKQEYQLSVSAIREVVHYEQLALNRVEKFLASRNDTLSASDKLVAAEQALTAVARFHEAAREGELRKGSAWDKIRDTLRQRLLKMVAQRLQALAEKDDWDAAITLAADTTKRFSTIEDQKTIAEPLRDFIVKVLNSGAENKYKKARLLLEQLERTLPHADASQPIRQRLIDEAKPLLVRAEQLKKDNQPKEARRVLLEAQEICPFLPGLRDLRLDVDDEYPTLRVGVRELPISMSPATAFTESEQQIVEMLFQGLYEMAPEPDGGRFRPALARGRPSLVSLGREIALPRDGFWSDGKPITAADVTSTLRLLRSSEWPGKIHCWADDLIDDAVVTDPFQVKLTLKRGYLDPLALMTFKILPQQTLRRPDDKDFSARPIGSGPFMLDPGAHSDRGRAYARFLANPYYHNRQGRSNLPRIREIQLFETKVTGNAELAKDFAEGRIDLLPDVPADMVSGLRKAPNVTVAGPLPNRRIYFLAVNHRRPDLDSAHLRRAISLAIPREKLLDDFFRADLGKKVHHALNGPYPVNTWANPSSSSETTDPQANLAKAKEALKLSKKSGLKLELKYPRDDPAVEKSVKFLADHLSKELGIQIIPAPDTLRNLRYHVEGDHDYSLAYYWYDYPDPTFSLWPLLDSRSTGVDGRNFLGYNGAEGQLENLCRQVLGYRNFTEVKALTHGIHKVFMQKEMPFIPLWQLDRHIAFSNAVQILDGVRPLKLDGPSPAIDPLRLFATVEYWRVVRK